MSNKTTNGGRVIDVYTLDTRFFFTHLSLKLLRLQRIAECILPSRVIRFGGPRSVLESLVIGAKRNNWRVRLNPIRPSADRGVSINLSRVEDILRLSELFNQGVLNKYLIGPNIDLKSIENNRILGKCFYSTVLIPSKWTEDIFNSWEPSSHLRTSLWPAGVDEEFWKPKRGKRKYYLVYKKGNIDPDFERDVATILSQSSQIKTLVYGRHSRRQYRKKLKSAKAVIWLGTTETQGLALCEAWAMDTPTFVLERNLREILGSTWKSSSAPYLTPKTGSFFSSIHELRSLLEAKNQPIYSPREWVLENQTAVKTFNHLIEIANTSQGNTI